MKICDRSGKESLVADHLNKTEREIDPTSNATSFPDEQFLQLQGKMSRYIDLINYLMAHVFPIHLSQAQYSKLRSDVKYYMWDDPYL